MIVEQVSGSAWAECPNGVESAVSSVNRTAETHAALSVWPFLREPSLCATFRLVAGAHGGAGRVDADERCAARADSQFEICAQRAR